MHVAFSVIAPTPLCFVPGKNLFLQQKEIMNEPTLASITETYRRHIEQSEKALHTALSRIRYISLLRLLIFLLIVLAIIFLRGNAFFWPLLIGLVVLFLCLMKRHNRWFQRRDYLRTHIDINQQELNALAYDYSAFDGGDEYKDPTHAYSYDLDLFGEHSLFQSINRTSTPIGKETLAYWFCNALQRREEIESRQEAVRELMPDIAFRQEFRLMGLLHKGQASDKQELEAWTKRPAFFRQKRLFRALPYFVLTLNIVATLCAIAGWIPGSTVGGLFTIFAITGFFFTGRISKMQQAYGKKLTILTTYARQIGLIEQYDREAAALRDIRQSLVTKEGVSASYILNRLTRLLNSLDRRNNVFMLILLNGLFFWEIWQTMRIERWKEQYASLLPQWMKAVGSMDAFCSLATFAYNHPDYLFPTLSDEPFVLQAEALGHPLIPRDRCVRNDIILTGRPSFIIVTGANMAGKSTYLRTVGINFLLGSIGAPVWARSMSFTPVSLITSLRTTDSLTANESYFFAELKRLRLIISRLEAGEQLFIILDEILKGTNSVDKQKGSQALIEQFIRLRTNGIIATHDLALGQLAEAYPEQIKNFCFEADITHNELTFSYRMRPGVAQNMNACFLMKKMGIAIIDECPLVKGNCYP